MKVGQLLRSSKVFWAIMILFVFESLWIAFSAAYPMVFDENTHFGIIKLFSHQWSPIFLHQPPNSYFAGPLTRNPSYLYEYLLSFPYRLLIHITSSQMAQIIVLRCINIGLFGSGLVLFRRLLLKTKASPALIHIVLLFFVLIPVVPLLAGQINYDNLIMPAVALALLVAIQAGNRIASQELIPWGLVLTLITLCMGASLVQFEFLPVFGAIIAWLLWQVAKLKQPPKHWSFRATTRAHWRRSSRVRKVTVLTPFVLIAALFVYTYGINIAVYHNPSPQCDQVLTRQDCKAFGPWERNQVDLAHKTPVNNDPLLFGASWTYRMLVALFYSSSGGASPQAYYLSINPLPVIFGAAGLLCIGGLVLALFYRRQLWQTYNYFSLFMFVGATFCTTLFIRNYDDFIHIGQKIAINGRYLLPLIPLVMVILISAYGELLKHRPRFKIGVLGLGLLLFSQGGGTLTYVADSNSSWYWPSRPVARLNADAQTITKLLIVDKTPLPDVSQP